VNNLLGHLFDVHAAQGITFHDELQDKYGSVAKVYGMMGVRLSYLLSQ
jgi:hypothetical protein